MALPSNKSSSSAMISSRENHNSRNSEISNPIRKSFGGNPFTKPSIVANQRVSNPNTPANSPSEFQQISSMGRESVASLRGCEYKENPKDQNAKVGIVRSPAYSKGTKNFMSPTISAASKITASPRKKILGERNEPARTSLSFSNEKNPFRSVRFSDVVEDIDAKEDPDLQENKTEAADDEKAPITASSIQEALRCEEVLDSEVPLTSKIESKSLPDEPDCVNIDQTFKISPTSSCSWSRPTVASLDADPSMPPYDPKANYLSPRPQFLHYRPNPRIELYLNKESDGRRLEESFSDTEVTEETQSDHSQRENEDASSGDLSKEEEQEDVRVSEPSSFSTYMPKEIIEAKGGSKLFSRSKCIGLFLLLSLACLSISVTNSPVIEPSVLKVSSFFKINDSYEIAELAKANFDGLARNFWLWYANTISVVSKLMQDFRGVHILGPLHYCNLTTLSEDIRVDGYLMFDHSHQGRGRKSEHNVLGPIRETKVDSEPPEEEGQPEPEADENIVEAASGQHDKDYEGEVSQETEEVSEEHGTTESEEVLLALEAEVTEPDNLEAGETQEVVLIAGNLGSQEQSNVNYEQQPVTVPTADEIQPEVSEAGELQGENEKIAFAKIESAKDGVDPESSELGASAENIRSSEVWESTVYVAKDGLLRANVLGIALLVLMLIAATAVIYMMKDGNTTPVTAVNVEQPLLTKKLDFSPICSTAQIFLERPSSRNWPTEMDVDGESCPSEMSSFQTISSYSKKGFEASSEAQSQERRKPGKNHKRDSIASSSGYSMGSPSYGSFTTYEKITSKHGHEDEETITPVRRSSRIRNKVTSP